MNPQTDIVKELEELGSPLAKLPRVLPYAIPDGYFTTLTAAIQDIIIAAEDPVLSLPKEMPFAVPEHYFDSFANSIMDKVEGPAFGKNNEAAYEVPAGYFEGFADQMLIIAKAAGQTQTEAAPKTEQETRTISFRPKFKAMRWAAAALLIAGIGIGSYRFILPDGSSSRSVSVERQLAMLDKNLINSYVEHHIDEFDMELLAENSPMINMSPEKNIHKLDKQDIKQYLDEAGDEAGIN